MQLKQKETLKHWLRESMDALRQAYPRYKLNEDNYDEYALYCALARYHLLQLCKDVGWEDIIPYFGVGWNPAEKQEIIRNARNSVDAEENPDMLKKMYVEVITLDRNDDEDVKYILQKIGEKLCEKNSY